jgi:CheY-like chemotaxis protein
MFFEYWPVLIVDDDQDVLSVSQLAMKRFEVYGLPLKIHTAASRADAVALLNDDPEVANSLAIAFLDVVMETDSAGLELCEYIRNTLGNKLTQLIIRTGQPGIAPEREVIDNYDINGYFSKAEATQDKLYSLVKSGVRQYLTSGMAQATIDLLNGLIAAGTSRQKILHAAHPVGGGQASVPRWLFVEGQLLFADEVDTEQGAQLFAELSQKDGMPLNPFGDRYVTNKEGAHLIQVSTTRNQAPVAFLFKSRFAPPEAIINLMYSFVTALAVAWQGSV